ncbi:MAG: hypothetical protein IPJ37_04230 [Bacteroidales bacterium]|nr:hypothetical protein [Bacteroidales bacterium]
MTYSKQSKKLLRISILGLFMISVVFPEISAADEPLWPKVIKSKKGEITIYQPQPETLDGTLLSGRAAVSVKAADSKRPVFGAVWMTSTLIVDRDTRIAVLTNIKVPNIRFSDEIDSALTARIIQLLEEEMPKWKMEISMDELISTLESASVKTDSKFKNDPPEIIISNKPAVLVFIDGKPILKEMQGYNYQKVENSPFFIIFDPAEKAYFMYGDQVWFTAADIMGAWEKLKKPSSSLKKLQEEIEKANNPEGTESVSKTEEQKTPEAIPAVIVRTTPAELIVIDGEPEFTPIQNTNLLYVKNTESYVFMDIQSQNYYILISGRWYSSAKMTAPWAYVNADKLPQEFANIPEGSDKDGVLASVAGTDASKEAILDSQIPQTAEVDRRTATVNVEYDGEPKFEKVDGTSMVYAANSPQTVLRVSNKYYCVDNGIWFESNSGRGPWQVAVTRPQEVDNIEPTSTVYNVKYVYIYDVTPEIVYVGYTPGYYGSYVYGPTVVYGTGYHYYPWYGTVYYPRPVTYGFSMYYNPYTGWGMSYGMSYGPVHIRFGNRYYGGYYGCAGYHPPYHYHPSYGGGGYYGHGHRPPSGGYPGHGGGNQPGYGRPDRPSSSGSGNKAGNNIYSNNRAGVKPNVARPSTGNTGGDRRATSGQQRNNVYADKSGNVYQKTNKGWDQRQGNDWKPADKASTGSAVDRSNKSGTPNRTSTGKASSSSRPSSPSSYNRNEMDRQSAGRDRGATRTNNSSSYSRSSSPSRSSGGGGASRSGGGGRRR